MQGIKFKSTKQQFDLRKSLSKLFDHKRECCSRLRALKTIVDAKDWAEVRETFNSNSAVIFSVFQETFTTLDSAKFNGHRKNPTEDDGLLFYIFEKILIFLPELLERRWQMNSIVYIFRKCLHPSNLMWIRQEAMRLFLIYFQILGEANVRANPQIEILYASLVPGIVTESGFFNHYLADGIGTTDSKCYGVRPFPVEPFTVTLVDQPANSVTGHANYEFNSTTLIFIKHLLDCSITQCSKINWREHRDRRRLRSFEFLFSSFARIYLPYIFPKLSMKNYSDKEWNKLTIKLLISIYNPPNELPKLRKSRDHCPENTPFICQLQSIVVKWVAKYLLGKEANSSGQSATLTASSDSFGLSRFSTSSHSISNQTNTSLSQLSSSTSSLSLFNQFNHQPARSTPNLSNISLEFESEIFRSLLNSKRFYVDLVMNLFHQAFLWNFTDELTATMRDVVRVFRQWIYKETTSPLPLFLAEPSINNGTSSPLNAHQLLPPPPVSNDEQVCAGYMNMLNIFITSSANVFLLEVPSEIADFLERQVDICKRLFNIYRYMVMKIEMDRQVWENLIQVLIRVTDGIVGPELPIQRDLTLGGRLAPALFQTLVVTWIKANLNIPISNQLWDEFQKLVSSLTRWEELVYEWGHTMVILNRVMSRYVFHINLNELPMDKTITDRKRELRNKPKLHHIRTVNSGANSAQQNGKSAPPNPNNCQGSQGSQTSNEQISRTSSATGSVSRSDLSGKQSVYRLVSNDSTSEMNGSISRSRIFTKVSTAKLHAISVDRHRDFHNNYTLNRVVLKRSLSDSCLALTVQQALCPVKCSTNTGRILRKRSCKSSFSGRRYSKKNHVSKSAIRNLPMIDDEVDDDEESCTLAESVDYQHDLSDNDNDEGSLNEFLTMDYVKRKTLFRVNSTTDLYLSAVRNDNHHVNGSDSVAETLSLGALAPECHSLKETLLTFDSTSAASTCSSSMAEQQMSFGSIEGYVHSKQHPVIAADSNPLTMRPVLVGGTLRGWNTEAAAILWRRMLEILGDINDIDDPILHKMAFNCLASITEDFTKIRDNITYLNAANNDNSQHVLIPSLHYFTTWLFRATTLPQQYKAGRLMAYKLLCTIAMYRSEQELSKQFLVLFYVSLKRAIVSNEMDLINTIIKYCGSKFFSASLYGSSVLLFQFITAANSVVGSIEFKTYPRTESLQLLGSLIGYFDVFSNVFVLKGSENHHTLEPYAEIKEHVIEILICASKREQTGLGRVIAFCSMGIFLYREFMKGSEYGRTKEIINILLAGTRISVKRPKPASSRASPTIHHGSTTSNADNSKFNNRVLCRVACDMLRLIADHAQYLMAKHSDFAQRIIQGLCYTLELHIDVLKRQILLDDFKNLLLCIMFCLSHWCMSVGKEFLLSTSVTEDHPGKLFEVFANGRKSSGDETDAPGSSLRPCLLDLVTALYVAAANIDPIELVRNQSNTTLAEAYKSSPHLGEMDTIDYTIENIENMNPKFETQDASPRFAPRKSLVDQQIESAQTIKKAAHLILLHFLNFMGHFPFPKLRTASLSALINENDDNPYVSLANNADKVDYESLNAPNVLVFAVNDTCLMSFVELPADAFQSSAIWSKLSASTSADGGALNVLPARPIRVIIRNVLGKFAWDCMMVLSPLLPEKNFSRPLSALATESTNSTPDLVDDDDDEDEKAQNIFKSLTVKDDLELLVNSIQENAPECQAKPDPNDFLQFLNQIPEAVDTVALMLNQHYQESNFKEDRYLQYRSSNAPSPDRDHVESISQDSTSSHSSINTDLLDPVKAFQHCRQMIEQFGFLSWEKRKQIELLSKSRSTVLELRHLDNQQCRDKHKIAVIYVGPGQETKESILMNKSGSRAFEEFVSRLGWEVNLATHAGFMGGLQSNLSTGLTAPYFADSFNEVIFHVSTRLEPATATGDQTSSHSIDKQQLMNMKMRHLGNDEIHIVWSEHYKEYRRSILATEFADALIVIYPLPADRYPNLFRIQLMRKTEVPFFGPLFHGAVVHRDELPGLVRATAINASRGKRLNMDNYKPYFEERYDAIKRVATKFREPNTFEEYAKRIYAPRYDLLRSELHHPTRDISNLTEYGFIALEDFVQCVQPGSTMSMSVPSTPHSFGEPHSPASSTVSSDVPFLTPPSPAISGSEKSAAHPLSSGTSSSLRGFRPSSRSSVK